MGCSFLGVFSQILLTANLLSSSVAVDTNRHRLEMVKNRLEGNRGQKSHGPGKRKQGANESEQLIDM